MYTLRIFSMVVYMKQAFNRNLYASWHSLDTEGCIVEKNCIFRPLLTISNGNQLLHFGFEGAVECYNFFLTSHHQVIS